jgi:anti-sigma factor RsiW
MKDNLLDLALAPAGTAATAEEQEHLHSCPACAAELESMRRTMAVMDEWKAPEPSPYFDSRLRARLRDEATKGPGLLEFLRRPALAAAFTLLFVAGLYMMQGGVIDTSSRTGGEQPPVAVSSGAVSDLETLDNNYDLYAEFEGLDDLDTNGNGAQVNQ